MSTVSSPHSSFCSLPSVDSGQDDKPAVVELPLGLTGAILRSPRSPRDSSGGKAPLSDYDFPDEIIDEVRSAVAYAFSNASQAAAGTDGDKEMGLPNPNISLYCPHEASHDVIDSMVDLIALERGADIVVLDSLELVLGKDGVFGEGVSSELRSIHNDLKSAEFQEILNALVNIQAEDSAGDTKTGAPQKRIVYMRDFGAIAGAATPFMIYLLEALRARRTAKSIFGILQPTVLIMGFSHAPDTQNNRTLKRIFSEGGKPLRISPSWNGWGCEEAVEVVDPAYTFLSPMAAAVFRPILFDPYGFQNNLFYTATTHQSPQEIQENAACVWVFPRDAHTPKIQAIFRHLSLKRKNDMWNGWIAVLMRHLGGQVDDNPLSGIHGSQREEDRSTAGDSATVSGSIEVLEELSKRIEISASSIVARIVKQALKLSTTEAEESTGPPLVSSKHFTMAYDRFLKSCEAHSDWVKGFNPDLVDEASDEETHQNEDLAVNPIIKQLKASNLNMYEDRLLSTIVDFRPLTTSFDDVCISPHIIESLRSIISLPLLHPAAFKTGILSAEAIGGILLYGPPGTGKTMVCRALAKECKAHMLQIKPSDVMDKWVGETEKLVQAIFSLAHRVSPCVIFIDELDALFRTRADSDMSWRRDMLNEFMQAMDGLQSAKQNKDAGVVVVGATNRPYDLDSAILRRLPTRMMVDLPGPRERERIFRVHLAGENLAEGLDIPFLARRAENYSGSDLKNLCVSAAMASVKTMLGGIEWNPQPVDDKSKPLDGAGKDIDWGSRVIGLDHFEHAFTDILASSTPMSHVELYAWHERFGGTKNAGRGQTRMKTGLVA